MNETQKQTLERAIPLNLEGYNLTFYKPSTKGSNFKWGHWKTQKQTLEDLVWIVKHYPNYTNIGVITGKISNLLVLDFDQMSDYQEFERLYPQMCATRTVKTSRGVHLWFRYTHKTDIKLKHPLCEVWDNTSHYASVEGNIHPTGAVYTLTNDVPPMQTDIVQLVSCGCYVEGPEGEKEKLDCDKTNPNFFPSPSGPLPSDSEIKLYMGIISDIHQHTNAIEYLGLSEFEKRGKRYFALCPAHADNNPSLEVNFQTGRVSCYNPHCALYAKDVNGLDVIDVVQIQNNCSKRQAMYLLALELGLIESVEKTNELENELVELGES